MGAPYVPAKQIFYNSDGSGRDSYITQHYGGTIREYRSPTDFHMTYRSATPAPVRRGVQAKPLRHRSPRLIMAERDMAMRQKHLCEFLSAPRSPIDNSLPKRPARASTQCSPRNRKLKSFQPRMPQSARRHPGSRSKSKPFLDRTVPIASEWLPATFGNYSAVLPWSALATERGGKKLKPIATKTPSPRPSKAGMLSSGVPGVDPTQPMQTVQASAVPQAAVPVMQPN